MTRWKASGIHLALSGAIAAVAVFVVLKIWYPTPLFITEGGAQLLFIMVVVDVIIGPLITLIVFKAGKPSLRFDLTVVGLLQIGALVYGCHVMFAARPVYIAFIVDQFEIVRASDIDREDIVQAADPRFRSLPLTGPQVIAVEIPKNLNALKKLLSDSLNDNKFVQHLPKYYGPYEGHRQQAVLQGRPADTLKPGALADAVKSYVAESGRTLAELRVLQLNTRRGQGAVLIDAKTGNVLRLLPPPPPPPQN